MADLARRARPSWAGLAAILLLAASFALRLWFLVPQLQQGRFWDERFSFDNVSYVLGHHGPRGPRFHAFYGSLSFLPQAGLLWASDQVAERADLPAAAIYDPATADHYSRTAYLLVRLLSALFGTASIGMLFLLGRRLFSTPVGLLGAVLFSATPAHVAASARFKPDALVVLLVLLTFWWSLELLDAGRRGVPWKAGLGLGLAVSAKYTGVAALFPLAVAALATAWRSPRSWRRLATAVLAAALTFLVLNPYLATVWRYVSRLWRIHELKAEAQHGTFVSTARDLLDQLVLDHTLPVALLALAGLVVLVLDARGRDRRQRIEVAMLLALLVFYSLLNLVPRLIRSQNLLPVTAVTSLLAAYGIVRAWSRLAREWPEARRRWVGAAAGALLSVVVLAVPFRWVYQVLVPPTWRVAFDVAVARLAEPRQDRFLVTHEVPLRSRRGHGAGRFELSDVGAEWRTADAVVVPASLFERARRGEGAEWIRGVDASAVVEPRWFVLRGPAYAVATDAWELIGRAALSPRSAVWAQRLAFDLPELGRADALYSLSIARSRELAARPIRVFVDGRSLPLSLSRGTWLFVSPRFGLGEETATLKIELTAPADPGLLGVELLSWRR